MHVDFLYIPWPAWSHQLIGFAGACTAYLISIGLHKLLAHLTRKSVCLPPCEAPARITCPGCGLRIIVFKWRGVLTSCTFPGP